MNNMTDFERSLARMTAPRPLGVAYDPYPPEVIDAMIWNIAPTVIACILTGFILDWLYELIRAWLEDRRK